MKLRDIAARLDCVLQGDGEVEIVGVVGIEDAGPGHITFVSNPKYAAKAKTTQASAIIVSPDFPEATTATLRHSNPYLTFARAVELFYQPPENVPGISPSSVGAHFSDGAYR
jgi:UDP-3-O-[3-hydroxymyristoyl] glucosamine N-acyltransferase